MSENEPLTSLSIELGVPHIVASVYSDQSVLNLGNGDRSLIIKEGSSMDIVEDSNNLNFPFKLTVDGTTQYITQKEFLLLEDSVDLQ